MTLEEFRKDPIQSNRILFNDKLLEDLIGAKTGKSQCCYVCGNKECRTVKIEKNRMKRFLLILLSELGLKPFKFRDYLKISYKTGSNIVQPAPLSDSTLPQAP